MVPATVHSEFSIDAYQSFLTDNASLSAQALSIRHEPNPGYYLTAWDEFDINQYAWLDSTIMKLELTDDEIGLLAQHGFMVTERVNNASAGYLLHSLYRDDLPVFISSDIVLNAFHFSFDQTWKETEINLMKPNLLSMLTAAYESVPELIDSYGDDPVLVKAVEDAELFITVALSLLEEKEFDVRAVDQELYASILDEIAKESLSRVAIFSDHERTVDFSQFIPRGRYDNYQLRGYFRSMMWLGRMEFYLTAPPANPWEPVWTDDEIRRMCMGAMMVNELVDLSGERALMDENEEIIGFMMGESDNCTPTELDNITNALDIESPAALLDSATFDALQAALLSTPDASQQILGNFLLVDPFSDSPSPLPASYRLMGQRFIIDSYVFSNVVYDRIVHEGSKVWRPLPDPLDAMFVLGNNDAAHLLQDELERYHYAPQLAGLRYLVDAYEPSFWESTVYNRWLNALRQLNPQQSPGELPDFATTAAWRQEKLTTQLASWAHLRHDTLLYAKQSYTGGTACSFPHSYVEPYPAFYHEMSMMAREAATFFGQFDDAVPIADYYSRFAEITTQLEVLAEKELAGEAFSEEEETFCRSMLFANPAGSGEPPFSGWFAEMYYNNNAEETTQVIADVHTQPTDQGGAAVGRVLHVGTGMFNLAVVLAPAPSYGFAPIAFAGPVMSYYEVITNDFDRLDDGRWQQMLYQNSAPDRPDWINLYCADVNGDSRAIGRVLPTVMRPVTVDDDAASPQSFSVLANTPNPFNPSTTINFTLPSDAHVNVTVHDILGRRVATLANHSMQAGSHALTWNAEGFASGVYFCRVESGESQRTIKMLLMK